MSGGIMNTRLMQLTVKRIRTCLDHKIGSPRCNVKSSTSQQVTDLKCEG